MQGLLNLIVRTIGIKKALTMIWSMADGELKKYVKSTANEYDDNALIVLESFVNDFIASK